MADNQSNIKASTNSHSDTHYLKKQYDVNEKSKMGIKTKSRFLRNQMEITQQLQSENIQSFGDLMFNQTQDKPSEHVGDAQTDM